METLFQCVETCPKHVWTRILHCTALRSLRFSSWSQNPWIFRNVANSEQGYLRAQKIFFDEYFLNHIYYARSLQKTRFWVRRPPPKKGIFETKSWISENPSAPPHSGYCKTIGTTISAALCSLVFFFNHILIEFFSSASGSSWSIVSRKLVSGFVLRWCRNHSSISDRSKCWPAGVVTGSVITRRLKRGK